MEKRGKIAPFKSLDVLRGLAALWVVMCHATDHYVGGTRWEKWPVYWFSLRGTLGVVLFFLISGYCITGAAYSAFASGKPTRRFLFERVRRIYPPYFFTIILALIYVAALALAQRIHLIPTIHHPVELGNSILFWLSNLFLFQGETRQPYISPSFWSLCYEVAFYAIVGAFLLTAKWISKRRGAQTGLFIFSLAIAFLTLESLVWQIAAGTYGPCPIDRWYQFGLGSLFFLVVEINSGALAGYSAKLRAMNCVMLVSAIVLTVTFAITRSFSGGGPGLPTSRLQSAASLLFLAVFWILRKVDRRIAHLRMLSPLFLLGAFSYSLYLVHPYFIGLVDAPARRLGFVGNWYLVSWALQIAAGVVAGWVFYLLVERHFVSSRQKKRIADELVEAPHQA